MPHTGAHYALHHGNVTECVATVNDRQAIELGSAQAAVKLNLLIYALLAVFVALVPIIFAPGLYDDFTLPKQALLLVRQDFA